MVSNLLDPKDWLFNLPMTTRTKSTFKINLPQNYFIHINVNTLNGLFNTTPLKHIWLLDLQQPVQSVLVIAKVESSNPAHCEVYSIQHYMIKFVSDLRRVCSFQRVLRFPPSIKLTTR